MLLAPILMSEHGVECLEPHAVPPQASFISQTRTWGFRGAKGGDILGLTYTDLVVRSDCLASTSSFVHPATPVSHLLPPI
jgi:hypothetical protein